MRSFSLKNLGPVPVLAVLWASAAVADDFQEGIEAFNNEDYMTALEV